MATKLEQATEAHIAASAKASALEEAVEALSRAEADAAAGLCDANETVARLEAQVSDLEEAGRQRDTLVAKLTTELAAVNARYDHLIISGGSDPALPPPIEPSPVQEEASVPPGDTDALRDVVAMLREELNEARSRAAAAEEAASQAPTKGAAGNGDDNGDDNGDGDGNDQTAHQIKELSRRRARLEGDYRRARKKIAVLKDKLEQSKAARVKLRDAFVKYKDKARGRVRELALRCEAAEAAAAASRTGLHQVELLKNENARLAVAATHAHTTLQEQAGGLVRLVALEEELAVSQAEHGVALAELAAADQLVAELEAVVDATSTALYEHHAAGAEATGNRRVYGGLADAVARVHVYVQERVGEIRRERAESAAQVAQLRLIARQTEEAGRAKAVALTERCSELQALVATAEDRAGALAAELRLTEGRLAAAEERSVMVEADLAAARERRAEAEESLQASLRQSLLMSGGGGHGGGSPSESTSEAATLRVEKGVAEGEILRLEAALARAEQARSDAVAGQEQAVALARSSEDQRVRALEASLAQAQEKARVAEALAIERRDRLADAESKLEHLRDETSAAAKQIARLEAALEAARADSEAAGMAHQAAARETEAVRRELDAERTALAATNAEMSGAREVASGLAARLESLQGKYDGALAEHREAVHILEHRCEAAESRVREVTERERNAANAATAAGQQVAALERALEAMSERLKVNGSEKDGTRDAGGLAVAAQQAHMEALMARLENQQQAMQREVRDEGQRQREEARAAAAAARIAELEGALARAEARESARALASEVGSAVRASMADFSGGSRGVETATMADIGAATKLETAEASAAGLRARLDEVVADRSVVVARLEAATLQVTHLEGRLAAGDAVAAAARQAAEDARVELSALKSQHAATKEQVAASEIALSNARAECAAGTARLEEALKKAAEESGRSQGLLEAKLAATADDLLREREQTARLDERCQAAEERVTALTAEAAEVHEHLREAEAHLEVLHAAVEASQDGELGNLVRTALGRVVGARTKMPAGSPPAGSGETGGGGSDATDVFRQNLVDELETLVSKVEAERGVLASLEASKVDLLAELEILCDQIEANRQPDHGSADGDGGDGKGLSLSALTSADEARSELAGVISDLEAKRGEKAELERDLVGLRALVASGVAAAEEQIDAELDRETLVQLLRQATASVQVLAQEKRELIDDFDRVTHVANDLQDALEGATAALNDRDADCAALKDQVRKIEAQLARLHNYCRCGALAMGGDAPVGDGKENEGINPGRRREVARRNGGGKAAVPAGSPGRRRRRRSKRAGLAARPAVGGASHHQHQAGQRSVHFE